MTRTVLEFNYRNAVLMVFYIFLPEICYEIKMVAKYQQHLNIYCVVKMTSNEEFEVPDFDLYSLSLTAFAQTNVARCLSLDMCKMKSLTAAYQFQKTTVNIFYEEGFGLP